MLLPYGERFVLWGAFQAHYPNSILRLPKTGTHSNTDILGQVSLLAVTKKKNIFFHFPFLEPERQQLSPLLIVTPFYTVVLNGHTVEMLENVGIIWLLQDAPIQGDPLSEMETPFICPFVSMVVFSDF